MIEVNQNLHRILAPRLVVTIGSKSPFGRKNIIPINNITSISTDPGMVIIAVYKPWITAENLKTSKGFTISVPHSSQIDLIWKLGKKFSGYNSTKDKVEEFSKHLDLDFSEYGPVIIGSLGWLECKTIDIPKDVGGNHLMVIGQYTKAKINTKYYDKEISPINNPKPFMQWERNNFAKASDVFSINFFDDKTNR